MCFACHGIGHLARVCRKSPTTLPRRRSMAVASRLERLLAFLPLHSKTKICFQHAQYMGVVEVSTHNSKRISSSMLVRGLQLLLFGFDWEPKYFGPNKFLVEFPNQQEVLSAWQRGVIQTRHFSFFILPWSIQSRGRDHRLFNRVLIRLRNLPLLCRNAEAIQWIIGGFGLLD